MFGERGPERGLGMRESVPTGGGGQFSSSSSMLESRQHGYRLIATQAGTRHDINRLLSLPPSLPPSRPPSTHKTAGTYRRHGCRREGGCLLSPSSLPPASVPLPDGIGSRR
jgi:hypothetical protein